MFHGWHGCRAGLPAQRRSAGCHVVTSAVHFSTESAWVVIELKTYFWCEIKQFVPEADWGARGPGGSLPTGAIAYVQRPQLEKGPK